jgi:4'-phosphopantetheinyl transferase
MDLRTSNAPAPVSTTPSGAAGAGLAFEPAVGALASGSDAAVDLLVIRLDLDAPTLEVARRLLSADERQRADRFRHPRDAARFVAGRGALRMIVGELLAFDPARLPLVYDTHGKPDLADSLLPTGLRFNLSHSEGLAICGVTWGRRIGVDVERARLPEDWAAIAERMFTETETRTLHRLSDAERPSAFFASWTRLEARSKASSEPLDRAPALACEGWTLQTLAPEPDYLATVAVEGPIDPLRTRVWSSWPA